jgi:hypothetical protein
MFLAKILIILIFLFMGAYACSSTGVYKSGSIVESSKPASVHHRFMSKARRARLLIRDGLPPGPHPNYELDHIVPECLDGPDTDDNIRAQPRKTIEPIWNAELKDVLEDFLCRAVKNGSIDKLSAQREIATDWKASYLKHFKNPERGD